MDELEYDIYDDLDVFKGDDKQQKEVNYYFINFFLAPHFTSTILDTLICLDIY